MLVMPLFKHILVKALEVAVILTLIYWAYRKEYNAGKKIIKERELPKCEVFDDPFDYGN